MIKDAVEKAIINQIKNEEHSSDCHVNTTKNAAEGPDDGIGRAELPVERLGHQSHEERNAAGVGQAGAESPHHGTAQTKPKVDLAGQRHRGPAGCRNTSGTGRRRRA